VFQNRTRRTFGSEPTSAQDDAYRSTDDTHDDTHHEPGECTNPPARADGELSMARILVVDDDPDITYAISLFLRKEGHDVQTAASRAEAMKALAAYKPDLMILDVMMEQPDDGIAMAQELRRAGNMVPIVMLTSVGKVTGMSFGRDNEMVPVDAFFEKPVKPDELLRTLSELLKK
jgi:DNA-binding response OmpR family regulator